MYVLLCILSNTQQDNNHEAETSLINERTPMDNLKASKPKSNVFYIMPKNDASWKMYSSKQKTLRRVVRNKS